MQVSLETMDGLKRRLTVVVPADKVDSKYNSQVSKLANTARIDGFRPGKVPRSVIEKRYADAIMQEITGELIQETLQEAIKEKELNIAGMPNVDMDKQPLAGQALEYKADFEVFPEITLADMSGIALEKPVASLEAADVDKAISKLREQHADWEDATDAAADKDRVTIDYEGKMDGEVFEGGSANDVPVVLGSNTMIPGFEDGIKGMKTGEKKTLDLSFPEDYSHKDYAGKAANFDVEVKKIERAKLPELNEEFLKKFNAESEEKLREDIEKNLKRELEYGLKNKLKQTVIDKLLETNAVDVPNALIEQEINRLKQQTVQQFGQQDENGMKQLMDSLPSDMFKEQAEKNVKVGLLFSELVKSSNMKASQDDVQKYLADMAAAYENPEQAIAWFQSQPQQMQEIEHLVLEEMVVADLMSKMTVSDKQLTFEEIVSQQQ